MLWYDCFHALSEIIGQAMAEPNKNKQGFMRNVIRLILVGSLTLTGLTTGPAWSQSSPPPAAGQAANTFVVPDFRLPSQVTLCGEEFPLHKQDVFERLDTEFTIAVHGPAQVYLWLKRAGRYFPHIEQALAEAGLPDDLKYLAVAESDLRPGARSPAKALGTWQFIEGTGKRYGLVKNEDFDHRLNFELSTEAATNYLRTLKNTFGSWLLAMAAYNCGEGAVAREIREQRENNYFDLDLPLETERYIYRIAAIKIILEHPEQYGYQVQSDCIYRPLAVDRVQVNLANEVHFADAARSVGLTYKLLKELNPEIVGRCLPKGSYAIYVPAGSGPQMTNFLKSAPAPLSPSPPSAVQSSATAPTAKRYHKVKPGETLHAIGQKTGVPIQLIKQLNNIKGSHITVGQRLLLTP